MLNLEENMFANHILESEGSSDSSFWPREDIWNGVRAIFGLAEGVFSQFFDPLIERKIKMGPNGTYPTMFSRNKR